jgi:hypothetical protein
MEKLASVHNPWLNPRKKDHMPETNSLCQICRRRRSNQSEKSHHTTAEFNTVLAANLSKQADDSEMISGQLA